MPIKEQEKTGRGSGIKVLKYIVMDKRTPEQLKKVAMIFSKSNEVIT